MLLLGFLAGNPKIMLFKNYRHFAGPLKVIGVGSMFMGLLYGGVFSNETLLEAPTRAVTGFLAGTGFGRALGIHETEKIIQMMPEAGNMGRIFYFFGFTLALGIILNSLGLILNMINQATLRRYDKLLFSKHGVAGALFFWYAVSIGVRAVVAGITHKTFAITNVDTVCLVVPIVFIVLGPLIARIASGKKQLFPEGILSYIIEGIVEILEVVSGYFSNTVSFLRVGAFAMSHAVLSFVIFTMAAKVAGATMGPFWAAIIIIFGNALIIVLEGMIVAIQVVRLHYYEFFGKFFTEMGTEFAPFRFRGKKR